MGLYYIKKGEGYRDRSGMTSAQHYATGFETREEAHKEMLLMKAHDMSNRYGYQDTEVIYEHKK